MTIPVSSRRNDYVGNGSVSTYAYGFKIFSGSGLTVKVRNTSDVETTLTLTTDYTVTGAGDAAGGTIVLVNASQAWLTGGNLTTGYVLTILGIEPLDQLTDIRNQGTYYPEAHEDTFDHLVMIDQQQQNQLDGAFRLPDTIDPDDVDTRLPIPAALKGIRWNADADGLENYTPGSADDVIFPGGSGVVVYDGSMNLIARTITGGTGITVTNGNGVSGNPTITPNYSLVNGQSSETSPATNDEIILADVSEGALNKMTLADVLKVVNALTADATPDNAADYLLSYDASASAAKKVLILDIFKLINALTADSAPDYAADYVMTYDASAGTAKKVLLTKMNDFFMGSISRDSSLTSNLAVTGLGFKPRLVWFLAGYPGGFSGSWGWDDGTTAQMLANTLNTSPIFDPLAYSSFYASSPSNTNKAKITTLDSDGFTLAFTKTGTPTGTWTIYYLAFK